MSEFCQEQHPLLCEDLSDDGFSPQYHRRLRPLGFRSRTRNNLKGAAAIITSWPDHWSSFLIYWWIGLGMICLMTFIIYNSMFTLPPLQTAKIRSTSSVVSDSITNNTHSTLISREVYMHVFVEENEEINLKKYMPYIETISNKYAAFNYHLLILTNDTNTSGFNDEKNNEIALNSLWDKDATKTPVKTSNINIEYVSLTIYMDNSPLRKYWRALPHQLIEFMARAISIWNKGGIAFNPNILTPKSSHSVYMDKLKILLNKFAANQYTENKIKTSYNESGNHKQELNNIRDIINALEKNDDFTNSVSHEILAEAEDKALPAITKSGRYYDTADKEDTTNETTMTTDPINHSQIQPRGSVNLLKNSSRESIGLNDNSTESSLNLENSNNSSKQNLLPLFLKFLFHGKGSNEIRPTETTQKDVSHRTRRSVIRTHKNNNSLLMNGTERKVDNKNEPIINLVKENNKLDLHEKLIEPSSHEMQGILDSNVLTIDLKGNIIATETPCHAFLGTIFGNAMHHNVEETVTDFIIAELSVFCKGLLSTCMGIDLILL